MIGRARSTNSSGPPAMAANVPAAAPIAPPETGTSIMSILHACFSFLAVALAKAGEQVALSTNRVARTSPLPMPSAPNNIVSNTCSLPRHVKIISVFSAKSTGEAAISAPASAIFFAFSCVRFHTTKEYPASNILRAMGAPISPSPI